MNVFKQATFSSVEISHHNLCLATLGVLIEPFSQTLPLLIHFHVKDAQVSQVSLFKVHTSS